jgi:hypothetical protein
VAPPEYRQSLFFAFSRLRRDLASVLAICTSSSD